MGEGELLHADPLVADPQGVGTYPRLCGVPPHGLTRAAYSRESRHSRGNPDRNVWVISEKWIRERMRQAAANQEDSAMLTLI